MQKFIIISIFSFSIAGIAIGQIMSRMVVRPLKNMEKMMEDIPAGKLKSVTILSKDREIISLTQAFNRMLTELELRQKHLIQRGKVGIVGDACLRSCP